MTSPSLSSPAKLFQQQQQHQQQHQQHHRLSKMDCCITDRMQHHQQFLNIISKVANWIATSDRNVCLFADDKSLSTVSPSVISESGELERRFLAEQLQLEAIARAAAAATRRRHSSEKQVNNHNEEAMLLRRKREMRDARRSKQHSQATRVRDGNKNAIGAAGRQHKPEQQQQQQQQQQEDPYLERIIQHANKQIRSAVYRLRAERRLPENCNLRMRLTVGRNNTGKRQ